jgi:6-phosphogluconolactonase
MSFLRAARAARTGQNCISPILASLVVFLALLSLSCGNNVSKVLPGPNHRAYVTLPQTGAVLLLNIDGSNGAITTGAQTPPVNGTTPNGLALHPSKKFLYAVNSQAFTVSIFNVNSDGTLTLSGTPTPAGPVPFAAVIDPTGKYLLVTNDIQEGSVSVFSIDSGSGALSEVAGSPFFANASPTNILMTPSGESVYVTNPGIGMVTAFSFSNGVLTQKPGSPVFSGSGASALAVDGGGRFLYVANSSASNLPEFGTIGNISAFNIDPQTGALTTVLGSPFTSITGTVGPTALTLDPSGKFVYAVSPGSSASIWCFTITPTNGQLTAVTGSPFSQTSGGLFAFIDPSGDYFYIGDQSGNGVAGYTLNPSTGAPTAIIGSPFSTGTAPGMMVLSE